MKLVAILLFVAFLHVSAIGLGQNITLSVKDSPLEQVLNQVRKQSGRSILWDEQALRQGRPVTLELKNATLEQALDACLAGQPLIYAMLQDLVLIKQKPALVLQPEDISLLPYPPVKITARGVVYNEAGQPLAGANITEKESGHGTITNAKGEFQLTAVPVNSILIITFIGYTPQQIKISNDIKVQIYLKVANNELDKVVIQAYGTTTQRLATGNIATVNAAQIERHPVMNVLEALQGQVPGLIVQQTSGYASAPFKVEIRGRNGIDPNLPSEPLYIIDGVPLTVLGLSSSTSSTGAGSYSSGSPGFLQNGFGGPANGQSPLFSVNPSDIESVTVLKDADATAIYGSRGANGVILITTKKGKPGRTKFDINVYTGANKVTQMYKLLNLHQYLDVRREAFKNDGITPDAGNAYDLVQWDTTKSTDWQKMAVGGIGKLTDVDMSLSGGDKITTFRISGNYHHQTSPLNYSGADQRGSVQFNLSRKSLDQKLSLSFTGMYSFSQSDLITTNFSVLLPPDAPGAFDSQGHLNYAGWEPNNGSFPFANLLQPYTAKTSFLNSQLSIQYELFRGLVFSTSLGYSANNVAQVQVFPIASEDPATNPYGSSQFGNNNGSNAIVEPQLEYKTAIGKGKFSALIGASAQTASGDGNTIEGYGYINDALLYSASNAPTKNADNSSSRYRYAAVFGRINYNWEDKYVLNFSVRRDGSSRFGPGKQYGNFASIGAAWIFTQENWFKDHLHILSFGKLRGSYGTTGSDQVGDYQYLTAWSATDILSYQPGVPAYIPTRLANPNFQWEVNKKLEAALNLGFLNSRLSMEAAFYRNRCDNQLINFPLPTITGFQFVTANSPANVQNTGWEITLKGKLVETKNLDLSVYINAGRNYNKLLSYPNILQSPYYAQYQVGKPLNIVGFVHYTGLDPETGNYSFRDQNKDGQIIPQTPIKGGDYYYRENNILLDGGFGMDMRYKSLQVNAFFTYRDHPFVPNAIYNGQPGTIGQQSPEVLNRWQKPGDLANFSKYTTLFSNTDGLFTQSDGVYSNGSYIRLRSLSISYSLPGQQLSKMGMQGCKLFLRGENLFILTKYDGIDPDTPNLGQLPPSKIFTGGIQFNF